MIDANNAMRQAYDTAAIYFEELAKVVDRRYPNASENARLAAVVELSKVASSDYMACTLSGSLSGAPLSGALSALSAIDSIPEALESVARAIDSIST